MDRDGSTTRLSRRAFLRATLTGAGAALLAACGAATPAAPAATSAPAAATAAPAPTSAPAPTAAAAPTTAAAAPTAAAAAPTAAATAAAAAPTPAPTATPAPLPEGAAGKLTVIHRTEYFEVVQQKFRDSVTQFAKDQGVQLDISTANPEVFGDFMAKMQAAVQAGVPPDLGYHTLSIPQMVSLDIVEDVSDVVDEAVKKYGDVVPVTAAKNAKIDGKWWAVPFMSQTGGWFARKDVFEAAGIDVSTLDTLDKRRDAALKISDPSKKMWGWGLTINKSGDGHGFIVDVIQAFGGAFVDKSGQKVVFNSPESVAAVKWLQETYTSDKYKPMLPPGVESWTDTNNNEAYLAGTIALTSNQFSIYAKAKKDGNPVFPNTALLHKFKTNDGKLLEAGASGWLTIFKGSKNIDVAKKLIVYMLDPKIINPMVQEGGALILPAYKNLWTDEILKSDPNFATLKEIIFNPDAYTGTAYPADPNAAVDGIIAAAIPSQMMANVTTGKMTAEEAVKDAHDRIVQLFEEAGLPQS
jgi:multiple sugar transport system substrate-binding protein